MWASLQPYEQMRKLQDGADFTALMVLQEELKTLPFEAVWNEYLARENVKGADWYDEVKEYEKQTLSVRM